MEKMSLYQIATLFEDTLDSLDVIEDEEERANAEQLLTAQIGEMIENKTIDIVKYNRNLDIQREIIKAEKKRLDDLLKRLDKRQERMDNGVYFAMKKLGVDKLDTALGKISIRKNPLSVELEDGFDLENISSDFIRVKTTKELDKTAIKDVYKTQGIKIRGVKYNEDKESVIYK